MIQRFGAPRMKGEGAIHPEFHLVNIFQELVALGNLIVGIPYFFIPAAELNAALEMDDGFFESPEILETLAEIKVRARILRVLCNFLGQQTDIALELVGFTTTVVLIINIEYFVGNLFSGIA